MKTDIRSRQDIEIFINRFYETLLKDPDLKDKFENLDLQEHLPRIIDFWDSILFQSPVYSGSAFNNHENLNLKKHHFPIWLGHFNRICDEMYVGPKVKAAKTRAQAVANIFISKLNL